jgi:hypothetical protein
VCTAGQMVLLGNNTWHCGLNTGHNTSISTNIIGAGGLGEFCNDLKAVVMDLKSMWSTLKRFWDENHHRMDNANGVEKTMWNNSWKVFTGQVYIYNSQRPTPPNILCIPSLAAD